MVKQGSEKPRDEVKIGEDGVALDHAPSPRFGEVTLPAHLPATQARCALSAKDLRNDPSSYFLKLIQLVVTRLTGNFYESKEK